MAEMLILEKYTFLRLYKEWMKLLPSCFQVIAMAIREAKVRRASLSVAMGLQNPWR
jgi:hypothetical protein